MDRSNRVRNSIQLKTFLWIFFLLAMAETLMWAIARVLSGPNLLLLAIFRLFEAALVLGAVVRCNEKLSVLGFLAQNIFSGMRRGFLWSAVFGGGVLLLFSVLTLMGWHPKSLIQMSLPNGRIDVCLFFLVGGFLAPITEELVFRGVLYGFLKRWRVGPAVLLSSLLFALAHVAAGGTFVVPAVGGVLFAVAYEIEKNIMVPITIHMAGNMTIFALSFASV